MEEQKSPLTPDPETVRKVMDSLLERLTILKEKAIRHPEFFNIEFSIDRGLAYDVNLGCVVRKNPEVTTVVIREIVDPMTQKTIEPVR